LVGGWSVLIDGGNGCGLRPVQCGGVVAQENSGGYVEQHLVPAFCFCRDQLYTRLRVRSFRGVGFVGWGVRFDDPAAPADGRAAGGVRTHMKKPKRLDEPKFRLRGVGFPS
jgi:hypothetical protein